MGPNVLFGAECQPVNNASCCSHLPPSQASFGGSRGALPQRRVAVEAPGTEPVPSGFISQPLLFHPDET